MLTADLVKPRLKQRGNSLTIEFVDEHDPHWLQTAEELIRLLAQQVGQPRYLWEASLDAYEGERVDYIILRGLAKTLADNATFAPVELGIDPMTLRTWFFSQSPVFEQGDLFHHSRTDLIIRAATEFNLTPEQIDLALFSDLPHEYQLQQVGKDWTPDRLLSRYNLELARGVLYWARRMEVEIYDNFKDFWKYLKLFKLMFWARPVPNGYEVIIEGPISPFVQSTTRYGRQMAAFLPALLLGNKWKMSASVHWARTDDWLTYKLDHNMPLSTHFKASGEFDSRLEADFAAEFLAKFGDERGVWQLSREDEVLLLGDTVMIPDFAFTHKKDGRRALLEIIGFWHPQYLRRKLDKLEAAQREDLILLVYEGVNLTENALDDLPNQVLYFKNKPVVKEVVAMVEQIAR